MNKKTALFADDVTIYMSDLAISFTNLISTLHMFGTLSAYRLNVQKTTGIRYHFIPSEEIRAKYRINYNVDVIKYLGIYSTKTYEHLGHASTLL